MPNQENIDAHKWQKGQTGNPNGRPKKLPDLDRLMEKIMGEEKDGVTAVEAILKRLRQKAAQGDTKAANALLDRAYGKPKQRTEITGAEGEKLTVNFNLNPRRRETPQEEIQAEIREAAEIMDAKMQEEVEIVDKLTEIDKEIDDDNPAAETESVS